MSNNINKKELANLIKADLQDVLTNDSRWKRDRIAFYFNDYLKWAEEEIWIHTDNEELKKELEKNRLRNWDRRLVKIEQKKQEYEKKYGKSYHEEELNRIEKQNKLVLKDELEAQDWQEIINLMDQINPLKEKKDQTKKAELDAKLASHSGLTYWAGRGKRSYGIDEEGRKWYYFTVIEKGQEFMIYVPEEHSSLASFPFDTEGFYVISGIDYLPIAEKKKYWWIKRVGLSDKITIAPYEVENNDENEHLSEDPKKEIKQADKCLVCQKRWEKHDPENWYLMKGYHGQNLGTILWAHLTCYQAKEQELLQNYQVIYRNYFDNKDMVHYETIKRNSLDCYAGKKDQEGKILKQRNCPHCQPWKFNHTPNSNVNQTDIKSIIQYFQKHSIKKIQLVNGELVITHNNNNETVSTQEVDKHRELQLVKEIAREVNSKELTKEELEKLLVSSHSQKPTSNDSPKKDYTPYLIGGVIILIIVGVVLISYRFIRKVK